MEQLKGFRQGLASFNNCWVIFLGDPVLVLKKDLTLHFLGNFLFQLRFIEIIKTGKLLLCT